MLHIINTVEPEAWAAILSGLGAFVAAILMARKGARQMPPEVGHGGPAEDRSEYVLREVRKASSAIEQVDERVTEIDRRTEQILVDTRILLDRR